MSEHGYPPEPVVPTPPSQPDAVGSSHPGAPVGPPPVDAPGAGFPGSVPGAAAAGPGYPPPGTWYGQAPSPYGYYPPMTPPAPQPRRRGWIWAVVALAIVFGCIIAACVLPLTFLGSGGLGGPSIAGGDAVAVIRMDGVIAGSGDTYSGYITPRGFNDQLQMALDDPAVKAIVLDVECPGGTVAASEEISRYVKGSSKPVVVSIGDVGASGAYMVASQADEIWAMPGSTVGSIGVIAQIPNGSELLDKLGVEFNVITAGKHKDAGSPFRPMTKEERALFQGSVDEAYDQFIDIVAEGRSMERSEVTSLATGWAWSGAEAKELGLVDKLGTYEDALDAAAKRGGIKGDDYEVIDYYDEFPSFLQALIGLNSSIKSLEALGRDTTGAGLERPVPR